MQGDFKNLKKELSSKKVNNLYRFKHIKAIDSNKLNKQEQICVLDDLQDFLSCSFNDFCDYEKWLEEFGGRDKKR